MLRTASATIAFILLGTSLATAGVLTQTTTFDLQDPVFNGAAAASALDQFDPTLGVLTSVQITLNAQQTSNYILKNTQSFNIDASLVTTVVFDLASSAAAITSVLQPDGFSNGGPFNLITEARNPIQTLTPGQSASFGPLNDQATGTVTITTPADLALFIGTGALDFLLQSTAFDQSGNTLSGILQRDLSTQTGGALTLTYNYTVPEPASVVMLGLAVGALGVRVRRREARG